MIFVPIMFCLIDEKLVAGLQIGWGASAPNPPLLRLYISFIFTCPSQVLLFTFFFFLTYLWYTSLQQDPFEAETDIVRQVSSYDAHVQEEEDEQVALAIQQSQQEAEERRRTRDLEEKHAQERGETQNYDNSSSSSLKDKQDGQTSEEKDKRKQFEEHVKQDEQLPPPPPPLEEEHNNISSRAPLDDEQRIIRESLKDKGQTKPSEDDDNGKFVEAIPPPR